MNSVIEEIAENRKILSALLRGVDVTEVYSPERVVRACAKQNLAGGTSFDLATGWDFTLKSDSDKAFLRIKEEQPNLVIGSPPCTHFSILQNLNWDIQDDAWREKFKVHLEKAKEHVQFCVKLYKYQIKNGKYWLHEHPKTATSWQMDEVRELLNLEGTMRVETHMCRFGMTTTVKDKTMMVKKPTYFATNSWCIARELGRKCMGGHAHGHLMEGRAKAAAVYPDALCAAICRGLRIQLEHDRSGMVESGALHAVEVKSMIQNGSFPSHWVEDYHELDGVAKKAGDKKGEEMLREQLFKLGVRGGVCYARDDITGADLDPDLVKEARELEMKYFREMRVYDKVPREQSIGKPTVKTMWIDINKGDMKEPKIRSRLVGKEYRTDDDPGLYAATPPLEALRIILSRAANDSRRRVMVNDVSRAYFNAPATRELYIEIPKEDKLPGDGDVVGKMRLCLYGTRDAALNWQNVVSEHLICIGFVRSTAFPCVFWHPTRDITCLVHGDDYASTGLKHDLRWFNEELQKKFEIKTSIVGPGKDEVNETKILNRVIRHTSSGWELEADPRHAEFMIEELGLKDAKPVVSPGEDAAEEEMSEELDEWQPQRFRSLAARSKYQSADRPDIQYSVKELCRCVSKPTKRSWEALRRLVKFLVGKPRLVWRYQWEGQLDEVDGYSDSNWAGCKTSRKSTSGGAIMIGSHLIRSWSKTQATIAQSSAEAELFGGVKTACETIGIASLLKDLGQEVKLRMHMDASAALGIAQRKGVGKVRHLSTGTLWLQEKQLKNLMDIRKIAGSENIADMFTKNIGQQLMERHISAMMLDYRIGRATTAAELHALTKAKAELTKTRKAIDDVKDGRPTSMYKKDHWIRDEHKRVDMRLHFCDRRAMFTPLNSDSGPRTSSGAGACRTTIGHYKHGGEFVKTDNWKSEVSAGRRLVDQWTGITVFSDRPLASVIIDKLQGEARMVSDRSGQN